MSFANLSLSLQIYVAMVLPHGVISPDVILSLLIQEFSKETIIEQGKKNSV